MHLSAKLPPFFPKHAYSYFTYICNLFYQVLRQSLTGVQPLYQITNPRNDRSRRLLSYIVQLLQEFLNSYGMNSYYSKIIIACLLYQGPSLDEQIYRDKSDITFLREAQPDEKFPRCATVSLLAPLTVCKQPHHLWKVTLTCLTELDKQNQSSVWL